METFGSLNLTQRVMEETIEGTDDWMDEDAEFDGFDGLEDVYNSHTIEL